MRKLWGQKSYHSRWTVEYRTDTSCCAYVGMPCPAPIEPSRVFSGLMRLMCLRKFNTERLTVLQGEPDRTIPLTAFSVSLQLPRRIAARRLPALHGALSPQNLPPPPKDCPPARVRLP